MERKLMLSFIVVIFFVFLANFNVSLAEESIFEIIAPEPTQIDLNNNPTSLNGTYSIDRAIFQKDNEHFLDTEDDFIVYDHKGEVSIFLDKNNATLRITFKHQMKGEAFMKDALLEPYEFIFYDKTIRVTQPFSSEAFAKLGLHVYNMPIWELPYENNVNIVLVLKKESDEPKEIKNVKYLFL